MYRLHAVEVPNAARLCRPSARSREEDGAGHAVYVFREGQAPRRITAAVHSKEMPFRTEMPLAIRA